MEVNEEASGKVKNYTLPQGTEVQLVLVGKTAPNHWIAADATSWYDSGTGKVLPNPASPYNFGPYTSCGLWISLTKP